MQEKKCNGDHEIHICKMAEERKLTEIKDFVNNPDFMCSNCGRVSNLAENLCNPLSFQNIGPGIPLE